MIARWLLISLVLAAQLATAAEQAPRTIAVSGKGEVKVAPDRATVRLGVESRRLALADARQEVNKTVAAFLAYCKQLDIADKDIATSGAAVRPEYSWNNNVRRLTGYYVARSLVVELTALDKLGELIEGAVDLGVNQVSDPIFGLTDRARYEREALTLAAEDARRNAATLAAALGVTLGPVMTINAVSAAHEPPQPMMMRMEVAADAGPGAETYRSGEITFETRVEASFAMAREDE